MMTGMEKKMPRPEFNLPECPVSADGDGRHCLHWYGEGRSCCFCDAEPRKEEEESAR